MASTKSPRSAAKINKAAKSTDFLFGFVSVTGEYVCPNMWDNQDRVRRVTFATCNDYIPEEWSDWSYEDYRMARIGNWVQQREHFEERARILQALLHKELYAKN